ncbi:class F sortase [Streptomyces sp. GC420]|uniref:class F sortase n=1 Tax=Streptomyces sp. GC420 TaxID=2697568 RepID=UPI0014151DA7|nr:class F sortase [Streptomyces sp. GC420]NBM15164.1 class F sortase [Streptomyces sp. GC420]
METGRGAASSPLSFTPSGRLLAWALILGTVLVANGARDEEPPRPSARQGFSAPERPAPAATATSATPSPAPSVRPLPPSPPVRIRVPAVGVSARVAGLALDETGALEAPPADPPGVVGWYAGGTTPGSAGTAVTAGHVDTTAGPGVFYSLGALDKGDAVEVQREDGRTAVFTVDAVELYAKRHFPDEKVYGSSGRPELRLITCGGDYSEHTGYQGNVVVYASLTEVRRGPDI